MEGMKPPQVVQQSLVALVVSLLLAEAALEAFQVVSPVSVESLAQAFQVVSAVVSLLLFAVVVSFVSVSVYFSPVSGG